MLSMCNIPIWNEKNPHCQTISKMRRIEWINEKNYYADCLWSNQNNISVDCLRSNQNHDYVDCLWSNQNNDYVDWETIDNINIHNMHGQLNKNNDGVKLALWTLASLLSIMMQSYKCSHRFSSKIPTLTYNCVNSNIRWTQVLRKNVTVHTVIC
jgi:hypothetical protein